MRASARRLERLTAALPPPAVTKLAVAVIDRLAIGEGADEGALADLENRVRDLEGREREAHRATCLLSGYLSEHTGEANARVAMWVSRVAGRVGELFALDDAMRYVDLARIDATARIEDARDDGEEEHAVFLEGAFVRYQNDAERMARRWEQALGELRRLQGDDPLQAHRAALADLEKKIGPDAVPERMREPVIRFDTMRAQLPETIAILEDCKARADRFARCVGLPLTGV